MKIKLVFILAFSVSGCAIWPFGFFPSWGWLAADGASYLTTGKSTTDHALSAIKKEDCAFFRVLKGERICYRSNKEVADIMYSMNCDNFIFDDIGNPTCKSN